MAVIWILSAKDRNWHSMALDLQDDDDCFNDVVDDRSYVEFDSVNMDFTAEKVKRGLKNADWYLEVFQDYTNAERLYLAVANLEASNYRTWWGIVRAKTKNFSHYDITDTQRQELDWLYQACDCFGAI